MTVAREFASVLSPEGKLEPTEAFEPFADRLKQANDELWGTAFRQMKLVRAFDREGTNLQRQGQLALYVQLEGQEAAQIGSGLATRPQDTVFPSYREHGVGLVRGLDLVKILALLRGVTNSGWNPEEENNFRNYTLVIASQTLHATGYAMGQTLDGKVGTGNADEDEATIVYFGDGSTSQGDLNEALVFAKSYNTPEVFFLQNNHWAISVPVSVQSPVPLYRRADGFGIPSVQIDGNDVMAAWAVTGQFMDDARAGKGPSFIEALTYRMGAHTTSDDPTKYRTRDEEQHWRERDPIDRLEKYLRAQGTTDAFFSDIETEAADYASDIRRRTLALPNPEPLQMFNHAYAEPNQEIERQQMAFFDFEASLEEDA
ncbi:thiamine pyrophosphate-dependent dehydrogenase E1 component subunit alpha [Gulosibacter molinativorax]|uniref:thiamine pyrophosphate-dependent dehydrogenase E1 component subunit alpha n=1 Tax=Gulosibacter molinativorax TaxID=256821 RepID=UPI0004286ED2|nr:thiamine pyrophosphate-dependent dehydrogenase E1 component subunit alpha [Gulosibacter molinativorax]QUY63162.1 Pyruvate dehydrogenase E1 component subunit alpha [Gulosibacter molinativorax]